MESTVDGDGRFGDFATPFFWFAVETGWRWQTRPGGWEVPILRKKREG